MTPDKPSTPDEGKPDAAKVALQAAEAKAAEAPAAAEDAPKPKRRRTPRRAAAKAAKAEGTAAESTGVDKDGAEAAAVTEPAAEAVTEPAPVTEPAAEAVTEPEPEVADKPAAAEKPAAKKPAARKPAADKPAQVQPAPAPRRRDRDAGGLVIVRAHARYVRSSARKARLVCDGIRGKSVAEARAILAFSPRHIAEAWTKLLESAVANAENNHDLVGEDLEVHAVFADEGPTIKRFRPRAMGRATQIRKRTSHLTIQLTPKKGG